jgi:tetratricopeptide (TPR) repeat protein
MIRPGIILCAVCLIPASAARPAATTDSLLLSGIRQTLSCDFNAAEATFRRFTAEHPGNPAGPFYRAANLQSRMMDAESGLRAEEFLALLDTVIATEEKKLASGERNAELYFYLGNAYSYKGLHEAKSGSLIAGVRHAHRGVGFLEKAIASDSTWADAYLGVGNYKYWAGRYYGILRILPWIRDERDLGVSMVRKAVAEGNLSRWVGVSSLGWIEYDRKRYAAGLDLFQSGLREFPLSRFFLWGAADCAFGMKDYRNAFGLYGRLLESLLDDPAQSGYNEAECRLKMMKSLEALGDREGAAAQADAILALRPASSVEKRIVRHRRAAIECLGRRLKEKP